MNESGPKKWERIREGMVKFRCPDMPHVSHTPLRLVHAALTSCLASSPRYMHIAHCIHITFHRPIYPPVYHAYIVIWTFGSSIFPSECNLNFRDLDVKTLPFTILRNAESEILVWFLEAQLWVFHVFFGMPNPTRWIFVAPPLPVDVGWPVAELT